MKPASILLSALLLSCLSIYAYAIEPGQIAVPSPTTVNMDMPTPKVSRPNMDIPDPISGQPSRQPVVIGRYTGPATNEAVIAGSNGTEMSSNETEMRSDEIPPNQTLSQVEPVNAPMNVSGKWSVRFDSGAQRSLELTLWPSADPSKIMGFGALTEGGRANPVTAAGSVADRELRLAAKLATPESANLGYDELDLDLLMTDDTLSGNRTLSGTYAIKSAGQSLGTGNATATKH